MRRLVPVALIVLAASCADASAAGPPPRGSFSGHTSQQGRYYKVRFRADGSQIRDEKFAWRATCRRGGFLRTATNQGSSRIAVHHDGWSVRGRYTGRFGPYTAHYDILRNRGKFLGQKEARGSFQVKVRVFRRGRPFDSCDTGVINWSAKNHG